MGKRKGEDEAPVTGADIALPLERLARITRAAEHDGALNPAQWETLRFLSRANRFSNSPTALTRYLGATKGTVSQTVMALERKGHIAKAGRGGQSRSISLTLTPKGEAMLALDPWARLAQTLSGLGGKTRRRLARGLNEVLAAELVRSDLPNFGSCDSCRFYREKGRTDEARGPHLCMLLEQPLTQAESRQLCAFTEPA